MSYLIDTNVLSEARRPRASTAVMSWLASTPSQAKYLSVLTIGEMRGGVERIRLRDPSQATVLESWLEGIADEFRDRIVPVDTRVAERWGRLNAPEPFGPIDGLIAATALVRGWTVVTRNVRHFERSGVPVLNPFDD
jgi:toxin FitB